MNYYPQYNYSQPNYYQQPQYQYQQPTLPAPQLNGKVVDSIDVVRATEVPIGSFGIYPKADQSEIYIKTWNVDGTTKIISYVPMAETSSEKVDNYSDVLSDIQKQITNLSKKIDGIKTSSTRKRKEVIEDDDE